MATAEPKQDRWWVAEPHEGLIEIASSNTGKVICSLDVEDYADERQALLMAKVISKLPELLSPQIVLEMARILRAINKGRQ